MSRNCFVPGCSTGSLKEKKLNNLKNKSIFKDPKVS